MKPLTKVLIIDRDGTIIEEPPMDFQVDSLGKLEFKPYAISSLATLSKLDYELVMATNQDGLGTDSFPEDTFWPAQNKMTHTLASEGVRFSEILIDKSFEHDNSPNRKPHTGMFGSYLSGNYDLASSFVIGDRITDVVLAKNLGAKAIFMQPEDLARAQLQDMGLEEVCALATNDWKRIAEFIRLGERRAVVGRATKETDIKVVLDLDGIGSSMLDTGLNFLNHMLDQIVHHAGVSLVVQAKGDLHIDEHHTIEDIAIVLGDAIRLALGSKRGIERYGYALPMDECSALVLLDFGGRIDFEWDVEFRREMIGDVPSEMFRHFFKSMSEAAKCNLHISARGENEHHKIEGIFKAFARAMKMAISRQTFAYDLPSSKGVL